LPIEAARLILDCAHHADDTEYTRAIGPRWPISSVARIYQPGCQVDHVLVLANARAKHANAWLTATTRCK